MAVTSNPLIGASKQKMGNAVFSTWKGINVLKTKPLSVANPRSDRQLMQRAAMSIMVLAFRNMPAAVDAGFKKLAIKMSAWNAFASYNLKNAFDFTSPPAATLVPLNVLVSKGTIASTTQDTTVPDVSNGTIAVTFNDNVTGPGQSINDLTILAAYNSTLDEWTGLAAADPRSSGTSSIPLPDAWLAGNSVTVYLGFFNPLTGESSDSTAITTPVVA